MVYSMVDPASVVTSRWRMTGKIGRLWQESAVQYFDQNGVRRTDI